MILDSIVEHKRAELARQKRYNSVTAWELQIGTLPPARDFHAALAKKPGPRIIAEVKKASPSRGVIRRDFEPVSIARSYESAGASAISVLTDQKFFQGHPGYLAMVKEATRLPVLRKDFLIDAWQIYESRAIGADAILLIVALLSGSQLSEYLDLAHKLGMHCLVEVHDEEELEIALGTSARIIGVNNRDLRSFTVDLDTTARMVPLIPDDRLLVSESGIHTREDIESLGEIGVDAVLIGEALMSAPDPGAMLKQLAPHCR